MKLPPQSVVGYSIGTVLRTRHRLIVNFVHFEGTVFK
jgi:hypothetical protein